jgi:hypothetical protein
MRINPPKAIIDENDPFKDALYGRAEFAESLTSLLRNVSENLVIFVNAPWGAGKTTFSEMWRAHLRKQNLEIIYFDSYGADYFNDPFVSFSGEILGLIDKRFPKAKKLIERREFKRTAIDIGKRLAGLGTKVGLRAATLGAVESAHINELKEIGAELASGVSEIAADVIEKKIENYAKEKDALKSFKHSLTRVAAKVRSRQDFPLTIIVDELDRCRPSFALELLERIKHLFDVENVAFVLLVNREQIESYIKTVYGDVDARSYLLKFGSLFVDLPNQKPNWSIDHASGTLEFIQSLMSHYGIAKMTPNPNYLAISVDFFADHFNLTLREIERVFGILAIYYGLIPIGAGSELDLLAALLSVLKVKNSSLYDLMRVGKISAQTFYEQTNLDVMRVKGGHISPEWAKDRLTCFLMSEAEFAKAMNQDGNSDQQVLRLKQISESFTMERKKIVPYVCAQLDRFSFRPG